MRDLKILARSPNRFRIVAFAYQGISNTTREKVVDPGPIQVSADKTRTLPRPPIVGAVALMGGIVLLVMGSKKG